MTSQSSVILSNPDNSDRVHNVLFLPKSMKWGLAGVLLAFLTIGILHLISVPPLLPADEGAHTGYALVVGNGKLPNINMLAPLERLSGIETRKKTIYVANHPPLYYLFAAIPLKLGIALGNPVVGFYMARFLSLLFSAAGIVVVALIIRLLLPKYPHVAVAGAGFTGYFSSFIHHSALIHNDSLAFLTSVATLFVAFVVLLRGPSRRRVKFLVLVAIAASLTRFSGLFAVGIAMLAIVAGAWFHMPGSTKRRIRNGVLLSFILFGSVSVCSGWFYYRNFLLYEDVTGAKALMNKFRRSERESAMHYLSSGKFWLNQHDQLWGRLGGGQYIRGNVAKTGQILMLFGLIGSGIVLLLFLRGKNRISVHTWIAWILSLCYFALLVYSVAEFHSRGGSAHARYLYSGIWLLGVTMAIGLNMLGKSKGVILKAGILVAGLVNVVVLEQYLQRIGFGVTSRSFGGSGGSTVEALRAAGIVSADLTYAIALCLLGVALSLQMHFPRSEERE